MTSTRIADEDLTLDGEPNSGCRPVSDFPRRDPRTPDPADLPECRWRGQQQWICGIALSWADAEDWYLIDWGDGSAEIAHPAMRVRTHIYSTRSACDNLTHTVTIRPLYRDGTTGPAVARSVVQARGWGAPQHRFDVYSSNPSKVYAGLFRQEPPLGFGIAWDPNTAIEQLPDGESTTDHTYESGPPRTPLIGVLDRPARRLRWFSGPVINKDKRQPGSTLTAWFGDVTEWDGGYSGKLHVANHSDRPLPWIVEFRLDNPGVLREVWPIPAIQMRELGSGRWRIWSTTPIPAGGESTAGMRVEPPGHPERWPQDITARPLDHHTTNDNENPTEQQDGDT